MKGLSPKATTAENLVKSFNERDDVDFLYVSFHPSGKYFSDYNLSMLFLKTFIQYYIFGLTVTLLIIGIFE